jgi:hypothetical protein
MTSQKRRSLVYAKEKSVRDLPVSSQSKVRALLLFATAVYLDMLKGAKYLYRNASMNLDSTDSNVRRKSQIVGAFVKG